MNAITDLQGTNVVLDDIPLQNIRVSSTRVQTLRRQHYNPEKLLELAQSIAMNGVLQPILVRVAPTVDELIRYEIVAGERRYLAADRAGLAHIPCVVRDLDDIQTLQAQLVENIEREDLSALEEATGFREMLDRGPLLTAEKIGERIGKSRSYVYARLKLLDLIPAARDALAAGTLDASKALILARIHGEKMQTRALRLLQENTWWSYRRLMEKLRDDFMTPLAGAPWLPDRDTLHVPKTGDPVPACATCPHNSRNDSELDAEVEGGEYCTDRGCFDLKTKWHWHRVRKESEAAGKPVLTGDAAAEVLDLRAGYMRQDVKGGHVRLDAEVYTITFDEPEPETESYEDDPKWRAWADREQAFHIPTYRELLGEIPERILVEGRAGQLVEVAPIAAVAKALKAKGIKVPGQLKTSRGRDDDEPPVDPAIEAAERAREEERNKVELEYRARLLKAIHAKWKPPLKPHDLQRMAEYLASPHWSHYEALEAIYPDGVNPAKMKEAELAKFIAIRLIADDCESAHGKPGMLLDYCQRLKIDAKKIRTEVVKELKPVSATTEAIAKKGKK